MTYDSVQDNTNISISTDSFNKENLVVLSNGKFQVSHYRVKDNYEELDLFQAENAENVGYYWVDDSVDVFVVKDFVSGNRVYFDKDFNFNSTDYENQVSVNYNSVKNQTFIDVDTAIYHKG